MKALTVAALSMALTGCGAMDILDPAEDDMWDVIATIESQWCKDSIQWVERTRVEYRREVRQRGEGGPAGPVEPVEGLDDKTAYGPGPVMVFYCEGDTVPREVWEGLVRDWED